MMPVASTDCVSMYDPEREREPQEARRDVRDERVDEDLDERAHAARRRGAAPPVGRESPRSSVMRRNP